MHEPDILTPHYLDIGTPRMPFRPSSKKETTACIVTHYGCAGLFASHRGVVSSFVHGFVVLLELLRQPPV